ncbi:MAG: hypothetical protein HY363_03875 [Candidatus Aenigmarchaeota archaeon]|nr:hypothetical protein [Candidatus Aenigmarchaeota archaeon]
MDETKMVSLAVLGIVAFTAVVGLILVESDYDLGGRGRRFVEDQASSRFVPQIGNEVINPYLGSRGRRFIEDAG